MMKADFSFIEYSYNPDTSSTSSVQSHLRKLGFVMRSQHSNGKASVWNQNNAIILLRRSAEQAQPAISGIGFLAPQSLFLQLENIVFDHDLEMWVTQDQCGTRMIFVDESKNGMDTSTLQNYIVTDSKAYNNPGLNYFSGLIYNCVNPRMMDLYQSIGFKFTKSGDNYNTLMSANNRFSILCNKNEHDNRIKTIILDTDDVFHATSAYTLLGVGLKKFDINQSELDFGSLNHKIMGYNCLAFGNKESYSIENFIPSAAPGVDAIFRTRKQYLHITENTLEQYYDHSRAETQ